MVIGRTTKVASPGPYLVRFWLFSSYGVFIPWKEIIHPQQVSWYFIHPWRGSLLVYNFPAGISAVTLPLQYPIFLSWVMPLYNEFHSWNKEIIHPQFHSSMKRSSASTYFHSSKVHSEDHSLLCFGKRSSINSRCHHNFIHSFMKRESRSTKSVWMKLSLALSLDCVLERDHPSIAGVMISRSSMKS